MKRSEKFAYGWIGFLLGLIGFGACAIPALTIARIIGEGWSFAPILLVIGSILIEGCVTALFADIWRKHYTSFRAFVEDMIGRGHRDE